jgi:hypothetical protein
MPGALPVLAERRYRRYGGGSLFTLASSRSPAAVLLQSTSYTVCGAERLESQHPTLAWWKKAFRGQTQWTTADDFADFHHRLPVSTPWRAWTCHRSRGRYMGYHGAAVYPRGSAQCATGLVCGFLRGQGLLPIIRNYKPRWGASVNPGQVFPESGHFAGGGPSLWRMLDTCLRKQQ